MKRTVFYTQLDSPWGPLFLAGTEKCVCSCNFIDGKADSNFLSGVARKYNYSSLQSDAMPLASAADLLERYFAGEMEGLDYPLDLQGSHFQRQVWSALRNIPLGQVSTYGEIAARIGRPGGARAVGQACGSNPVVLFVPCHRVVAAYGKLGGFGSGTRVKKALLRHEGSRYV